MSRNDARSTPFVIPFPPSPQPVPPSVPLPSQSVSAPPPPPIPLPIPVHSLPSLSRPTSVGIAAASATVFASDSHYSSDLNSYNHNPPPSAYPFDNIAPNPVPPPQTAPLQLQPQPQPPSHHLNSAIASPVSRHYPPQPKRDYSDPLPSNAHTFSGLTNGVMSHPFFALLFKKVFQLSGTNPFDTPQLSSYFADAESRAKSLKSFADAQGLDTACEKWTSTDVFMSALIAAFTSLQNSILTGTPIKNPTLHHTIASAERALNSAQYADPRFVGATRSRYPYPSSPSFPDRMIAKAPHGAATRTPLTEKAKAALERWFQENLENPYPTVAQKSELARICSMSLSSVNNWFGNKRMRIKRKMLSVNTADPNGYGPGDAPSISNKVLAPRSKWNAVVVSKMNSQAGREVVASATGRANIYADDHDSMATAVLRADTSAHTLAIHDARTMNPPP